MNVWNGRGSSEIGRIQGRGLKSFPATNAPQFPVSLQYPNRMCGDEISHGRGFGRNTKRDIIEVGKPKLVPSAQERLKPEMMRVRFCWEHSNFGSKGADCSFLQLADRRRIMPFGFDLLRRCCDVFSGKLMIQQESCLCLARFGRRRDLFGVKVFRKT